MKAPSVFIAYKQTYNDEVTKDAHLAKTLCDALSAKGITVFLSEELLFYKKGIDNYKKDVEVALNSAQVLVVIGTKKEYVYSTWLKYEYETFHKKKTKGEIISYISGIKDEDLPNTLGSHKCFDIDKTSVETIADVVAASCDTFEIRKESSQIKQLQQRGESLDELKRNDDIPSDSICSTNEFDVFISYKSEEADIREKVVDYLEQNKVNVWYAPRNLDHGVTEERFDNAIAEIIKKVRVVIVLVSEKSLNSRWVNMEVQRAEKTNKRIIPFVISEYTTDNGLVMRLETLHMIRAYPDVDAYLPSLLENVLIKLNEKHRIEELEQPLFDSVLSKKKNSKIDYAFEEGMALYEYNEKTASIEFFLRSAQRGNRKAKDILCDIFYEQNRDLEAIEESLWNTIESLSNQNEAFADFLMHCKYYAMGNQNVISLKYLQKSLEAEPIPLALLRMGICYNWGLGVKQNHILAIHYYKKALERGCKQAYSYIAQEYIWGNDKIKKSKDTAEQYIFEGLEKGDARCYSKLSALYAEQPEKYRETAKRMIEEGVSGGYSMMAEYYAWYAPDDEKDENKAREIAYEALDRNEKGIYGLLALLYNDYDRSESLKYAKIGIEQGNEWGSAIVLAQNSEEEKDYPSAWKVLMSCYEKTGTCTDEVGKLFFDHEYCPEGFNMDDLKQILMIGARNYNLESLKYLLRLMIYEQSGERGCISYDKLKNIDQAYEFIRLGADMGDIELQLILGRIMMETSGCHYNPRKGYELIEKVVDSCYNKKLREEALMSLLTHSNKNSIKWLKYAIDHKIDLFYNSGRSGQPLLLEAINSTAVQEGGVWRDYLEWASSELEFDNTRKPVLFMLINKVLEQLDFDSLSDGLKNFVRDIILNNIDNTELLSIVNKHFRAIFPDYNTELFMLRGKDNVDVKMWRLFVVACGDFKYQKYRNSEMLSKIFEPISSDKKLMRMLSKTNAFELTNTNVLKKSMDEFSECYYDFCNDKKHTPKTLPLKLIFTSTVPFIEPEFLEKIAENRIDCMREVLPLFDEGIRRDLLENIDNFDEVLNIAEKIMQFEKLQLFLVVYVENLFEIDGVFKEQTKLIDAYLSDTDEGRQVVERMLNDYRNYVDGDKDTKKEIKSDANSNDKDSDMLLGDFINEDIKQ